MRFIADQTLNRLTKWLRLLGFDAAQGRLTPQEWRRLPAPQPDTYFLTRQTSLAAKTQRPDVIVLASDRTETQLEEICQRLQLSPGTWEPLKRCSDCNHILVQVPPEQAEARVPEYISQKHREFFECPQCRRLFWEGSHPRRIRRQLQDLQERLHT